MNDNRIYAFYAALIGCIWLWVALSITLYVPLGEPRRCIAFALGWGATLAHFAVARWLWTRGTAR